MERNSNFSDLSLSQELGHLLFLNSRFIHPNDVGDSVIQNKLSSRFSLESHCNGLLFFVRYGLSEEIFVFNSLGQGDSQTLPQISTTAEDEPKRFNQKLGFGFSPSSGEYKVVRISKENSSFRSMIYTLGTTSWKEVASVPPYPIYGKPVYADGALHWKIDTSDDAYDTLGHRIVSFDIGKEEFFVTSHPNLGSERNDLIDLLQWRGCLAIADFSSNTHIGIWVMKDNIKKEWVREYKIKLKARDGESDNSEFQVICPWRDGEILLSLRDDQFISYDPNTDQPTYIHVAELKKTTSEAMDRARLLL